ncbi:hypothetical protein Tco_1084537, partial [Tanacetum coccineum]
CGTTTSQRHPWLRYQIEEYNEGIRHSYDQRLEMIWSRPVNRVHVLDFEGLTPEIRQDLAVRLRMVYSGEGQQVFTSHAWRILFRIRAPLVREFILEFLSTSRMSDIEIGLDVADTLRWQRLGLDRLILDKGDLRDYWMQISYDRDFLGLAPSYAPEKVTGVDLFYLRSMDRGTTNFPHLLARYLFRHLKGRKSGARLLGGHFIGRLSMHFRLAWVAQGPKRQQAAATGAYEADKAGLAVEEGAQEIPVPAPTQAPPPPLPVPQPQTMS